MADWCPVACSAASMRTMASLMRIHRRALRKAARAGVNSQGIPIRGKVLP